MTRREELERKYSNFKDWLYRHPITILYIALPTDEIVNKGWKTCSAALDNVKFHSESGLWRKTLIFQINAKVEND